MELSRREFVAALAAASAGMVLSKPAWAQDAKKPDDLNIAIIGAGSQGRNLMLQTLKIPGIRFKAVCDIWPYHQKYAANILKKYEQDPAIYTEYGEMLSKERDLQAVIVATPDWKHAEIANACLLAGLHVYCEKEMSNTLAGAASMVKTQRQTGKLLQIGHQRRSNPRYHHAIKLIEKDKVLGRITNVQGQWNRNQQLELGWPKDQEMDAATLQKYGYQDMDQFRNWRWYRKYSGGPMADLGSHQIDVFSWFLHANPRAVMADGGLDYYTTEKTSKTRDWYDNVLATYEWDTPAGVVRGFYQVLNTTSFGGYFETFMGDQGSIVISENTAVGQLFREPAAQHREWEDESKKIESMGREAIQLKIGETLSADGKPTAEGQHLLEESKKPPHQLHLENFFNAVRDPKNNQLSCPADVAYETAVAVLAANDSIAAGKRLELRPEQFKV